MAAKSDFQKVFAETIALNEKKVSETDVALQVKN